MKVFLAYGRAAGIAHERTWRDLGLYRRLASFAYRKDAEDVVQVYHVEAHAEAPK